VVPFEFNNLKRQISRVLLEDKQFLKTRSTLTAHYHFQDVLQTLRK